MSNRISGLIKVMHQIIYDIFGPLPRSGPGSGKSTKRAFNSISGLPDRPKILDIGCGPGMQTMDLAELTSGTITALDIHPPFVDMINRKASGAGLETRVKAVVGDMFRLDFPDGSFDLVWAEGSIYIIGFERGLREWRRLLVPGGYIAVTEVMWTTPNPPREAVDFWKTEYPSMKGVEENIDIAGRCGYEVLDHFKVDGAETIGLPRPLWRDPEAGTLVDSVTQVPPPSI